MSDNLHRVIEDRRGTNSSSWTSCVVGARMFEPPAFAEATAGKPRPKAQREERVTMSRLRKTIALRLKNMVSEFRYRRWVSPFGNSRIKASSQLPVTYRSVARPS